MVHPITLNILCFYTIVLERLTENDILQHHTAKLFHSVHPAPYFRKRIYLQLIMYKNEFQQQIFQLMQAHC